MIPIKSAEAVVGVQSETRSFRIAREVFLIIGASLFVALCAKVTWYLPLSPVPLTLSNFGVLLVGLLLGSRRGFAALLLYLAEGSVGLPVFTTGSLGIFGPTGGYLIAYPVVAFVAGWLRERLSPGFPKYLLACTAAELMLFASGIGWLVLYFHQPLAQAAAFGLYPFVAAEVLKVSAAAALAVRFQRTRAGL